MARRVKRRAVATILWHTIGILSHTTTQLSGLLRVDGGQAAQQDNPLRHALSEKEFQALRKRIGVLQKTTSQLRLIARHIDRTSREPS